MESADVSGVSNNEMLPLLTFARQPRWRSAGFDWDLTCAWHTKVTEVIATHQAPEGKLKLPTSQASHITVIRTHGCEWGIPGCAILDPDFRPIQLGRVVKAQGGLSASSTIFEPEISTLPCVLAQEPVQKMVVFDPMWG